MIDETATLNEVISRTERQEWRDANRVYIEVRDYLNIATTRLNDARSNYDECVDRMGVSACAPKLDNIRALEQDVARTEVARDGALAGRDSIERYRETSANIEFSAQGEVGVRVGYSTSPGTVDPFMTFSATADAPEEVEAGVGFRIDTSETLDNGAIASSSPGFEITVDQIANFDVSLDGKICLGILGCEDIDALSLKADADAQLVEINQTEVSFFQGYIDAVSPGSSVTVPTGNVTAEGSVLIGAPPGIGISVNGITVLQTSAAGVGQSLGTISVGLPTGRVDGRYLAGAEIITGTATDTIITSQVDIDTLMPLLTTGGSVALGPASISLDALDLDAGPTIDMLQSFVLNGALAVDLQFDKAVGVFDAARGIWEDKTSYSGLWADLPEMKLYEDTVFTPTFSNAASLQSLLGLEFGFAGTIGLFGGSVGVGPAVARFGPLIQRTFGGGVDASYVELVNQQVSLTGFNTVQGDAFTIRAARAPEPGPNNPNLPSIPTPVPLPAGFFLLLAGGVPLALLRRRARARQA